jgi:hypothetical protein
MALVFTLVLLLQVVASVALLGLRPGVGSSWLLALQVGLVLAFGTLALYAHVYLRDARREDLARRKQSERQG